MSIKTINNKFNLLNNKFKYGTNDGINIKATSLFVDGSNNNLGIGKTSPQFDLDISGNMNCSGILYNYGTNINTEFYPAVSRATTEKDISLTNWSVRPLVSATEASINGIAWSPQLGLFAACTQQGLQWRIVTSPDGVNWTIRNSVAIILTNVSQVNLTNCNNSVDNIITCASTSNLAVGANLSTGGVTTSSPSVTQIIDISSFVTSTLISGLSNSTLNSNLFTCTDTSGLVIGMPISCFPGGSGTLSGRTLISIPSSTQFILTTNRGWSGNTGYADRTYQGVIWCSDLSGVGMFIVTSESAPNGFQILTSTDGINWTRRATPSGFNLLGVGCAYSPLLKRVVVCGANVGFIYSDDGINWSGVNVSPYNSFYTIAWSQELRLFVCIPTSGPTTVITSPDGINWTPRNATYIGGQVGLTWSPDLGIFCAIGNLGPRNVLISSDGINWDNSYSAPFLGYRNLTWSPQLKAFLAAVNNNIVYSYDGRTWFSKVIAGGSFGLKTSCWSPELGIFVVAGNGSGSGSADAVFTSTLKGRVPAYMNMFDNSFNNIIENGLWNVQSFSKGNPVTKTTSPVVLLQGENTIIVNNSSGTTTITLPTASEWPGEELTIKTIQNQFVVSASNNVVPINTSTSGTAILPNVSGSWATLVSDGSSNWVIMKA
jgi:hypothetical protein